MLEFVLLSNQVAQLKINYRLTIAMPKRCQWYSLEYAILNINFLNFENSTEYGIFDFLTEDIAIDLGTANTLIIHKDKVVVDSPSIVAIDRSTKKVIAIGHEASMMQGKTHENIKTIRPLKDGVIADFNASEQMISMLIKSVPTLKNKLITPSLKMVICIPSGITEVEMRAVRESAERVNGKEVYLIHEPMAAAIGIGIDIKQPKGI